MIVVEAERSIWLGTQAAIIDNSREFAWAERHVTDSPDLKWIIGRYVEADRANDNGHVFPLAELQTAQATVANKPLNILHSPHRIVGHYVATELVYPSAATADSTEGPAHVEALSCFYRYYFPEEFALLEKAHAAGQLYYSMEAVPETLTCLHDGCDQEYAYDGRQSPTYVCGHLNANGAPKRLNRPHFLGGALIFPPVRPGWKRASVTEVSQLMSEYAREVAMEEQPSTAPDVGEAERTAQEWEQMMESLLRNGYRAAEGEWAKDFSGAKRKQLAKEGKALPDGSYPIENAQDLKNAIQAFGRATPGDRAKVKAHIISRAKSLSQTALLPDDWKS